MLIKIVICLSKLKSFCVKMISDVGWLGKSNVNRHWSVGAGKYFCDGIYCPGDMTWNGLCRSHVSLCYGSCKDEIVIWTYCVCICLHDGGGRSIYCEIYARMVLLCCVSLTVAQVVLLSCSSACPPVSFLKELSLSGVLGFCSLFYLVPFHKEPWDSLSGLMHSGIVCLSSQAPDWAVPFWDGLSGLCLVDL